MVYVFLAYSLVWLGMFGYMLVMSGRAKQLAADLALLESVIGEERAKSGRTS